MNLHIIFDKNLFVKSSVGLFSEILKKPMRFHSTRTLQLDNNMKYFWRSAVIHVTGTEQGLILFSEIFQYRFLSAMFSEAFAKNALLFLDPLI